jgi:hypothetical protein
MGAWTVVQQGMNETNRYARRNHWLSEACADFVTSPTRRYAEARARPTDLTAGESAPAGRPCLHRTAETPDKVVAVAEKTEDAELPPPPDIGNAPAPTA